MPSRGTLLTRKIFAAITEKYLDFRGWAMQREAIWGLTAMLVATLIPSQLAAQTVGLDITTDGMVGIRVGMSQRQVSHLIRRWGDAGDQMNSYECSTWPTRAGLAVVMTQRAIVTRIETNSPRLSTASGARVGMTEVALRRTYPRGLVREEDRYSDATDRRWNYYFYSSNGNGVRFKVGNGRVESIIAGRRSSITLAEGCA